MNHYLKICTLMAIFIFENVSSCIYSEEKKRYNCETPIEISVDGTEEWTSLILHNYKKTFILKKDTFKRTPNLKQLSVASLTSIEPGVFNGLQRLDKLVIFDSNLGEISVGVLENLPIRSIQIFKTLNNISPRFFDSLPDIREVDIRNNSLKEIKAGIFNNTPIYKLYLDWNEIETIEAGAFSNMEFMIFLSLTGNKLISFDSELLLGKPNSLQNLWLNRNNLTRITKKMFSVLNDLKKLNLEINQIESIEDESFYHLPELDFLDVSNNKLKEIQSKIFPKEGMKQMTYIFVHNNQLTFINNAFFVKTSNLKYISSGGNPFQCPCLDDIKDWTDTHNITRLCDDEYFSGQRPVCVFSDIAKHKCIYDVELTENLYEMYKEALKEYPKLNLKCDTTKGTSNALLKN